MKKILQILFFVSLGFNGNAQIISINNSADIESSLSLQQLVEDVLIDSDCAVVNTFSEQVFGKPSDLLTKSYGFFKKPIGSDFPFDKGVVLTTGQAFPAGNTVVATNPYPNFNNALVGDTDLELALSQTNTNNATFIKFNFVPSSQDFSFRFLMASEEYDGSTECIFADSFAFLLREVGTPTYTNLAVLPDSTPVSVTNITNSPTCPVNPVFFEGYNLGDTNYGGRTVVFTATATVIPNTTYEIKLVVADQGDSAWDSAIFLEAGSFNIGGDLGEDQTIASGNPGCDGTPVVLDATTATIGATYKWFLNGVLIPGEANATLSVNDNGTYSVEIDVAGGCNSIDEVEVEFTIPPQIENLPENMVICQEDNDFIEVFDFTGNESLALGLQSAIDFPISYHSTQEEAELNQNPLTNPYTNTMPNETIWMRIADITQACFEITSFNIEVITAAIANQPLSIMLCDDNFDGNDNNGFVTFDLSTKINEILGNQLITGFDVKFYYTQAEADSAVSGTQILTPIQNTNNPQTIVVRVENRLNIDCFDTTTFDLIVHPLPVINEIVELKQCDNDSDGFTAFNLTEANDLISTNALNEIFTYYLSEVEAQTGLVADQIINVINYTNPIALNSEVFARIEDVNGCYRTSRINLIVGATQIPLAFNLEYNVCDDKLVDGNNANGIAAFDFSDATIQIESLFPIGQNLTITYYTNEVDALAEINAISDISNHRNQTSSNIQGIYVRVDSDVVNACLGLGKHITLIVDSLPIENAISEYILCSDNDQANFDLLTKNLDIIGSQIEPILISYHLSEQDAINNIPIVTASNYTNISNPQTIYVRAQFDNNANGLGDADECINTDMSFDLVIIPNPIIFNPESIRICSDQLDTVYDITVREDQITGSNPAIQLSYFESQLDVDNNNPIADPTLYINTQLDRDIIILATGSNFCTSIVTLSLKTILYANLNITPLVIEECEIDNNGFDFFDITRRENEILNGLSSSNFIFTYFENEIDAIAGNSNNIINTLSFENTQAITQTIFVRVLPVANECYIIVPLTLIVNPVPEIDIENEYVICLDANNIIIDSGTDTFLPITPINTQLSESEFTFQWYNGTENEVNTNPNSVIIIGATSSTYSPTIAGDYTVLATNIITGCTIPASTVVVGSYPPESIVVELVSNAFSNNNILEITVIGNGDYEFSLDDGFWQSSSVFESVLGGEHIIFVRDMLNCNVISQMKVVIDYPKFFTPNGDGINDTWNIKGIATQPNAKIYIFDRYGKLLKQLSPINIGWDGTFNGYKQPTNDYWFTVEFIEPKDGVLKVFKAHFTLKR